MDAKLKRYNRLFFKGQTNRMSGSGGELIVKSKENLRKGRTTVIEPEDILVGIGVTHTIESMTTPPGPRSTRFALGEIDKVAARAFRTVHKERLEQGFAFGFEPLAPKEYSQLLYEASGHECEIDPETIPPGTMILSFIASGSGYTLERSRASPGSNWKAVLSGTRQWNVGCRRPDDFWAARFPSDDVGLLQQIDPWTSIGEIRFGLSLLEGSPGAMEFQPVEAVHPDGRRTKHDFHLSGRVTGTRGLRSDFYIGLRTEIICRPAA